MSSFVRIITRSWWLKEPWLSADDVPATALRNVADCNISVYEVVDDEAAERAAIAYAAGKSKISDIEYAVFDAVDLQPLDIEIQATSGTTPASAVNDLHRELLNMTVRKSSGLAQVIGNKNTFKTVFLKQVRSKISEFCTTGIIDQNKLTSKVRSQLLADN